MAKHACVFWWLVACALAVGARAARVRERGAGFRALCAPHEERCQPTDDPNTFLINGQKHKILYSEERKTFATTCIAASLDDTVWPRFPYPVSFSTVLLRGCAPPASGSYLTALRTLNVSVSEVLQLQDVPADANFTIAALADLPPTLTHLWLSARGGLYLAPGALAGLGGLRWLFLNRVVADHLPKHLVTLRLSDNGLVMLQPEALNVEELTIDERNLKSISGSAPRLRHLVAPALEALSLSDMDTERLEPGFLQRCGALRELTLRHVRGRRLYAQLLRGVGRLRTFNLTDCAFDQPTLPPDLFASSSKLKIVDLSFNRLEYLPSNLFSGLLELETLVLQGNRLRASTLHLAAPPALSALTALLLSGNPLGNLCPPDGSPSVLASLWQLKALDLSRTNATHLCGDWLRDMRALRALDLRDNALRKVSCAELHAERDAGVHDPHVDLRGNPLQRVLCTRRDYHRAADHPAPTRVVRVWSDAHVHCDCGAYWLWRVQAVTTVSFTPRLAREACADEWFYCATDEECGLLAPGGEALVKGGREAATAVLPWHAGVYKRGGRRYQEVCGGSLVSVRHVISAAHCFWDDVTKQQPASKYAVAVGKLYLRWDDPRDLHAQTFNVSKILLPARFLGSVNSFQADVAVVELSRGAAWTTAVRPVCLDFNSTFEARQLTAGAMATVGGWGLTEADGRKSSSLQVAELPIVPIEKCQADAPEGFRPFITLDKICAGYTNGSAALCKGDSGGGLVFPQADQDRTRYYLRGVASSAPIVKHACNVNWLTTFTQLSAHSRFLLDALDALATPPA